MSNWLTDGCVQVYENGCVDDKTTIYFNVQQAVRGIPVGPDRDTLLMQRVCLSSSSSSGLLCSRCWRFSYVSSSPSFTIFCRRCFHRCPMPSSYLDLTCVCGHLLTVFKGCIVGRNHWRRKKNLDVRRPDGCWKTQRRVSEDPTAGVGRPDGCRKTRRRVSEDLMSEETYEEMKRLSENRLRWRRDRSAEQQNTLNCLCHTQQCSVSTKFLQRVGMACYADHCICYGRICAQETVGSVLPCVWISVTFRCFVETNEATIMRFSRTGRTIILVSGEVKIVWKFARDHP